MQATRAGTQTRDETRPPGAGRSRQRGKKGQQAACHWQNQIFYMNASMHKCNNPCKYL